MKVFKFLEEQVQLYDNVLPFSVLSNEFHIQGKRVPLLGPQGIWKPAILEKYPISITSIPEGPYDDAFSDDSTLHYKYRGTDPNHRDNIGLKMAMQDQVPLVFFHRVVKGKYLVHWPVFISGANDNSLTFTVEADRHDAISIEQHQMRLEEPDDARRKRDMAEGDAGGQTVGVSCRII